MKSTLHAVTLALFLVLGLSVSCNAQVAATPVTMAELSYPWKASELIQPADLANQIRAGKVKAAVLNIGAVEDIPGALHIGAVSNTENLDKLKKWAKNKDHGQPIIIYCGCCPFTKCPNIGRAYKELKNGGFTSLQVLNLPTNLQTDWIAEGYPVIKGAGK